MGFNDYKIENRNICAIKGWNKININSLWLCMIEEVGELAASIRRTTKIFPDYKIMNIQGEIMDVFSYVLQLADMYNIDIDKVWVNYKNTKQIDYI